MECYRKENGWCLECEPSEKFSLGIGKSGELSRGRGNGDLVEKRESAGERGSDFIGFVVSSGVSSLVKAGGALEGVGDAWADVCWADVAFEFGLLHELGGLFARATEQQ